jgi:hypothetical protein
MCNRPRIAMPAATAANQICMIATSFPRSTMSARAPAGRVNRKNGSDEQVDIMDRNKAARFSSFIAQVAAVRWAKAQVPEITAANQITRKLPFRKAVQLELGTFLTMGFLFIGHHLCLWRSRDAACPTSRFFSRLRAR